MFTDAMICVHPFSSVLIGVEDKAIKPASRLRRNGEFGMLNSEFQHDGFTRLDMESRQGAEALSLVVKSCKTQMGTDGR